MNDMRTMRVIAGLLAAALVSVVAACGGNGAPGGAAAVVPEDVAVYVSVDTSFRGNQWRAVQGLVSSFPDGEGALEELLDEAAAGAGLSGGEDLRNALGPEVGIAVLELSEGSEEDLPMVFLTQPDDEDAFEQLLENSERAVREEVRGWQVVATDDATLDRYLEALDGPSLEDSQAFEETMDDLEEDALVQLYVDVGALPGELSALLPAGRAPSLGAVLRAEDDGVRVEGRMVSAEGAEESGPAFEPYEAELPEKVPGDVLAYISFKDLGSAISDNAGALGARLGMAEAMLGLSLEEDIAPLLAGEGALYVRAGTRQPAITFVSEVDDEKAALRTLDKLAGLGSSAGIPLSYAVVDGLLVVSTSETEIGAVRGDGDRLATDDAFEEALERAGAPDETTGFGYVDLQRALPLFLGIAGARAGEAPEAGEYLEPLESLVFWGSESGGAQRFSLFVGIE